MGVLCNYFSPSEMNQLFVNIESYSFTLVNEKLRQPSCTVYQDSLSLSYHCSILFANNSHLGDCANGILEFAVIVETILSCVVTQPSDVNVTPSPVVTSSETPDFKTSWIICVVPTPPYPGFPCMRDSQVSCLHHRSFMEQKIQDSPRLSGEKLSRNLFHLVVSDIFLMLLQMKGIYIQLHEQKCTCLLTLIQLPDENLMRSIHVMQPSSWFQKTYFLEMCMKKSYLYSQDKGNT